MIFEETVKISANDESKAKNIIEEYRERAKSDGSIIKKAGYEYKTKKSKGEIIAEVWVVTITQVFGDVWEGLI